MSIGGYSVLAIGIALILEPAPYEMAAAAVFGAIVGALRLVARNQRALQVLLPVVAAFVIAALTAIVIKHDLANPGLRALIASLVVFLPGAALTAAVLELAAGDMIAGASRLVWAGVQLLLLAFGILAGVEAVGVPPATVFARADSSLGEWAPWVGVLIFALGVFVSNSAPAKSLGPLLIVLYAAWRSVRRKRTLRWLRERSHRGARHDAGRDDRCAPALGDARLCLFLPGFWLLVPGALSLIGLTELAGDASAAGSDDFLAAIGSIFAVALGVLCGTQLEEWYGATTRRLVRERERADARRTRL
jgi:uncharacterized membrane protein YjjB (DUF3815 family)